MNSDSRLLADPACGHRLSRRRERLRCTPSVDFAAESSGSESAVGAVEVGSVHELLAKGRMLAYVGETEVLVVRTRRSELSQCPNVYMKIGGIGMPPMGVGQNLEAVPASSEKIADVWRPLVSHALLSSGPVDALPSPTSRWTERRAHTGPCGTRSSTSPATFPPPSRHWFSWAPLTMSTASEAGRQYAKSSRPPASLA